MNPFESFWTFVGTAILVGILFDGITSVVRAWRNKGCDCGKGGEE
jgi:hypothetical protein